jgi:hypothetical protein
MPDFYPGRFTMVAIKTLNNYQFTRSSGIGFLCNITGVEFQTYTPSFVLKTDLTKPDSEAIVNTPTKVNTTDGIEITVSIPPDDLPDFQPLDLEYFLYYDLLITHPTKKPESIDSGRFVISRTAKANQ